MAYTPKLTYKGRPLVRCGNDIYYGSMSDPYVVYLQVLSTTKENGVDVADKGPHRPAFHRRHQAPAGAHRPPGQQGGPVQRPVLR